MSKKEAEAGSLVMQMRLLGEDIFVSERLMSELLQCYLWGFAKKKVLGLSNIRKISCKIGGLSKFRDVIKKKVLGQQQCTFVH